MFTNSLIKETSPYLLQHAHNPVNWEPWSMEAFEKAKTQNKLLIISIGYSACHWCHVMERESFEDEEVAKLMNAYYVCIKVDREERPDVDQLFMDAAQLMIGRGGWPLNAFALPDGRPVYAGTYFPKIAWTGLLREIYFGYKKQPDKYHEYADKLIVGIKGLSMVPNAALLTAFNKSDLEEAYQGMVYQIDRTYGGRGRAPKFPMPANWAFLLSYYHSAKNEEALNLTLLTLDKMAESGIYDQIGGGFARYATDQQWKIPHFEKMLYDNAQLVYLYADAFSITKSECYKRIVYETIQFLERELLSPEGGFYGALDADSEGVEGRFYVWKSYEFERVAGNEHAEMLKEYFGIGREGLWENDENILVVAKSMAQMATKYNLDIIECEQIIEASKERLRIARDQRVRPGLDNKILLSWNALAIKGLLHAAAVFGRQDFFELAKRTLSFLQTRMVKGLELFHSFQNDTARIPGFLEDYALYIEALLVYYQNTFDEGVLFDAKRLTDYVLENFSDDATGFFWFTSLKNNELAARKIDTSDNVIPSPNSVMAHNLYVLGIFFDHENYSARAEKMLKSKVPDVVEQAAYYSNWAMLLMYKTYPFYEIAFTGKKAVENLSAFHKMYIPNKVLAGCSAAGSILPFLADKASPKDQSLIYVCENKTCQLPVEDLAEAIEMIIL